MKRVLENKWFLIRKSVFEDSRAQDPEILAKKHSFPSAVLCAYTFFITWYCSGEHLWQQDFIWCDDTDHNGDRIYVGRYHDATGINKDGFNIHRHLRIRDSYGCIEML